MKELRAGDVVEFILGIERIRGIIVSINDRTVIVTTDGKNRIKRHIEKHITATQ